MAETERRDARAASGRRTGRRRRDPRAASGRRTESVGRWVKAIDREFNCDLRQLTATITGWDRRAGRPRRGKRPVPDNKSERAYRRVGDERHEEDGTEEEKKPAAARRSSREPGPSAPRTCEERTRRSTRHAKTTSGAHRRD